ncbi:MAG: formimidoylglutamase [Chlamydiota bacterium]|nr:formimidoylglutamase [Chlamydiota bacterium]
MNIDLKNCVERYNQENKSAWKGRSEGNDPSYIHEIVTTIDIINSSIQNISGDIGLIGFASDEGVRRNSGRPGASKGPKSLRESLGKLPLNRDIKSIIDFGDINCRDGKLLTSQQALGDIVNLMFSSNLHPIILGGGHEVAYGTYQGIAKAFPDEQLTIVNFDAHYDLRPLMEGTKGTSGTPFYQIAKDRIENGLSFEYTCIGIQRYGNNKHLIKKAKELNVYTIYAEDLFFNSLEYLREIADNIIANSKNIYVTVCLDVFSSAIAPGVSAPQSLGIHPWHVIAILRELAKSGKVICLDIAELSPLHDINMKTAQLAASIVSDYIHHIKL